MKGKNRRQFGEIDTSESVSAPQYKKIVLRMADLLATDPGTEINIGASEVVLFADFPVDIWIGSSAHGARVRKVQTAHFRGNIKKLRVRKTWANAYGRLVIYAAEPALGVGWQRERPGDVARLVINPTLPVVWTGGAALITGLTLAMPNTTFDLPTEAYHLYGLAAWRASGTIERIQYIESETGATLPIFQAVSETVTDRLVKRFDDPVRLPAAGSFVVHGSTEVGNTDLTLYIETVLI